MDSLSVWDLLRLVLRQSHMFSSSPSFPAKELEGPGGAGHSTSRVSTANIAHQHFLLGSEENTSVRAGGDAELAVSTSFIVYRDPPGIRVFIDGFPMAGWNAGWFFAVQAYMR
jgi:hypothetical protein